MITFVIYAKKRKECDVYSALIEKFLFSKDDHYEIVVFDEFSLNIEEELSKIEGLKIFLLEVEVPVMSGINFAKNIRYNGDLISPIILLSEDSRAIDVRELSNVLFLNVINKGRGFNRELLLSLKDAYQISTRNSVFSFSIFDELYRLPYDEICYIEKNSNTDCVTIHTIDDSYQNYISIKSLEERLKDDIRFFKVHRSCIVNIFNVLSFDKRTNVITFKNGAHTNLISRGKKRVLIQLLSEISVH